MTRHLPQQEHRDSTFAFVLLFLYTASVLIRPHEMFVGTRQWVIIKIFAILCFLAVLIGHRPLKIYPQHWMLLSLVPLIIMSGFLNGSGMIGIEEAQKLFVSAIIPLFLYTFSLSTIKRQHWLMFVCLIAAMLMVHNGHTQQTSFLGHGWALYTKSVGYIDLGERRITYLGFFNDPNDLGMFLVMCIPFTIYFFSKGTFLTKLLMILVLASLVYGGFITGSRGTMVGSVALVGTYFLITYAGPKLFVATIVVAPIFAVVATTLQKNIDESASQRLEAWYHGIQMAMSNPIFGIGKAQFVEVHGRTAHNSYILILGELGFVGYSLWGGALIFTVFSAFKFLKYNKNIMQTEQDNDRNTALKNEFMLNQTLLFSMVGFMVTGFFLSRSYTLLLFIFVGMTLASHIRLVKLEPALEQFFNTETALRSMMYSWVVIIAVYITLKIGL